MSGHDYSGLDEQTGRWWGFWGATLLVVGSLIALPVLAVGLRLVFGIGD